MLADATKKNDSDLVFKRAAKVFGILATTNRLKIIHCLCEGEHNVTHLLTRIEATQSNMSQQLNTLHRAGILARRRDGVKIYYRIADELVANLCKAVCLEAHGKLTADDIREAA